MLNLGNRDRYRTLFIIIRHAVDPRAHGTATHQPGITGLQQIGRRTHTRHAGMETEFVGIWVENHWHPVVDGAYFPTLPHAGFLRVTVASPSIPGFGKLHLWRKRDTVTF